MKKWVWGIVVIIIVGMFGGYGLTKHAETGKSYDTAMKDGKAAIKDAEYASAEKYFDIALQKKSNDVTAQAYKTQVTHYRTVLDKVEARQYAKAKDAISVVLADRDASTVIKKRATNLEKELTTVIKKRESFTTSYDTAKDLTAKNSYTASNTELDKILKDSDIDKNYYSDFKKEATDLQKSNDKKLAAIGYPTSSSTSSSSSSLSSSSSSVTSKHNTDSGSSSAELTSEEKDDAAKYSGSNEYTMNSSDYVDASSDKITAARIKEARDAIRSAGVNPRAFSDSDVAKIIKQSIKEKTTVKAIAARDYK